MVEQKARRRERRTNGFLVAVVLVAVVAGLLVGVTAGDVDRADLWLVLGLPLAFVVAVVAVTVAFVLWRRRRGSALFATSPLYELPFRERNRLVKALRRGEDIAPERRDLALRSARDITRRRAVVPLFAAVGVVQLANAAIQPSWLGWLSLATGIVFIGLVVQYWWLIRRMRAAVVRLEGHPDG